MATSSSTDPNDGGKKEEDSKFECNICFESATDAVVSMCGHLFCWPCIHRWMETCPNNTACPVCKSIIDKERLIPLYGRATSSQKDPRDTVPPRPQGQREDAPQNEQGFFDMGGVNVSFGLGTFPFGFGIGPTLNYQTGHRAAASTGRRPHRRMQEEDQRRTMARFMLTLAILFIIMIIVS